MKPPYKAYRFESKEQFDRLIVIYGKEHFTHVPDLNYGAATTQGYIYEKNDPSGTWSGYCSREYFQKELMNWHFNRIEVLPEEWETKPKSPIERDLIKAMQMLGKSVRYNTSVGKVKEFKLFLEQSDLTPWTADTAIAKNGYSICVYFGAYCADINTLEIVPDTVKVKLNDKYDAEVHKDKIIVGCQTFEASKIEELAAALKSLQ